MKKSQLDKKIIKVLKNKVLSEKEIEEKIGYRQIYQRLRRLRNEGKIKVIKNGNRYLYYVDDEALKKWALKNKKMDILRKITPKTTQYVSVGIRRILYEKIRKKAEEEGISPSKYVENILLKKIKWV